MRASFKEHLINLKRLRDKSRCKLQESFAKLKLKLKLKLKFKLSSIFPDLFARNGREELLPACLVPGEACLKLCPLASKRQRLSMFDC